MTEIERLNNNIGNFKDKIKKLQCSIRECNGTLRRLQEQACELVYGVKVGSIVTSKGAEFMVTHVGCGCYPAKPWLKGVRRKKDGTWSKVEINFYLWEVKP